MRPQASAESDTRDPQPRAARPATCTEHPPAGNPAEGRFPRAELEPEHGPRTDTSVRAEEAYLDWSNAPPAERPLATARVAVATALFAALREHELSNSRFAAMLGIDEKTVRQWLDGTKPVPLAALRAMPVEMGTSLAQRLLDERAGVQRSPKRAIALFRQALDRVETGRVADAERAEMMRMCAEMMSKLAG